MSALALQLSEEECLIPELAHKHVEVLVELLRDVNLEKRMETLIKAQHLFEVPAKSVVDAQLDSIRSDLEEYDLQLRQMIFMVEKAQHYIRE